MLGWLRQLRVWVSPAGRAGDEARPFRERMSFFIGLKGRF